MKEEVMTSKSNTSTSNTSKAPKTDPTDATIDARYALRGLGKNRVYMAAIDPEVNANVGDLVRLHASYGGVNLGRLVSIDSMGPLHAKTKEGEPNPTVVKWLFDRVPMTPEQVATNRTLKAQAQAEFWSSDKGAETSARIAQRQAAKVAQVATDEVVTAPSAPVQVTSAPSVDRAALIADLKAAGFTIAEVMEYMSTQTSAPVATAPSAPAQVITSTRPMAPKPASVKASGPVATVKVTATQATPVATIKAQVKAQGETGSGTCPSCKATSKRLYGHVAGVNVCDACMNLDASTVTQRVARNHLGK